MEGLVLFYPEKANDGNGMDFSTFQKQMYKIVKTGDVKNVLTEDYAKAMLDFVNEAGDSERIF